jgi:DNA ligase (NAD+)
MNTEINLPTHCPSCGFTLQWTSTGVDLVCPNADGCFSQKIFRIENFLLAHEVEEITATTIKKLGVVDIEDLYSLDEFDISRIDGMGSKKAEIILRELEKTLNTTEEKLLKSFGIPGLGDTASKMIVNKFNDISDVFQATVEEFMEIDGIGEIMADNIVKGLKKNFSLFLFLANQGLKFQTKVGNGLQGKSFALTGASDIGRNDLTKMISSRGGLVKGISKGISFLVTNDINSGSSKTIKAKKYNIPIITYQQLMDMMN